MLLQPVGQFHPEQPGAWYSFASNSLSLRVGASDEDLSRL